MELKCRLYKHSSHHKFQLKKIELKGNVFLWNERGSFPDLSLNVKNSEGSEILPFFQDNNLAFPVTWIEVHWQKSETKDSL